MSKKLVRPFLKWAGGKSRIIPTIKQRLPDGRRLVEPFVGSGVVFLNTQYDSYLLADINKDLISLYSILQREGVAFIDFAQQFFVAENNCSETYYAFRDQFNAMKSGKKKAALFLYLNRHGYNGLCRYNSSGGFNVPFGRYIKPYFPRHEMLEFHKHSQNAKFICADFVSTMNQASEGDVFYCDPPYVPLSKSSSFSDYYSGGFDYASQELLAQKAQELSQRGIPVLLSNHLNEYILKTYYQADIYSFDVQRNISCKGTERTMVKEVLALYAKR